MKQDIQTLLNHVLEEMGISDVIPQVDVPEDAKNGDYTSNIAMAIFSQLKIKNAKLKVKNPREFAEEIKNQILKHQTASNAGIVHEGETGIQRVEVAGPGFINIYLSEAKIISQISGLLKEKKAGENVLNQKPQPQELQQKIMIEFADPNPFKEFHIGHMRNITLGESYCRLLEAVGHDVRRVNYQGDVGMHVAKSLWGLEILAKEGVDVSGSGLDVRAKAALLGRAYAAGAKVFEEDEAAKADIVALNKKIYTQDASIQAAWKNGRQWSLDYFDSVYDRVGTKFTRFYFEPEVAPYGMQLVKDHVSDGIFEESDGAIVYRGEKVGLHTRVFVTAQGYATYEAKDLALAPLKYSEWPYDLSIIMTGNEQSEYFRVMLAALKEINPDLAAKTRHMPFGMVNLTSGKMSSRTGNVVTAEWLIEEAKQAIAAILDKSTSKYNAIQRSDITEKAAVAAIKYSMLRVNATSDIAFDLQTSVSFEGDSGPYLQYTYARCRSVLRKAGDVGDLGSLGDLGNLNEEERLLSRALLQFPDVVADAAENFAPNTICTYLFGLAQTFNTFYAHNQILGVKGVSVSKASKEKTSDTSDTSDTVDTASLRLALTAATAQVIKNGLYLLGIEVLEQM